MIETLRYRTSRPRSNLNRLMVWILIAGLVLGMAASLLRLWPDWRAHGGVVGLGVVCALLYLPVLPALLVWQMRSPRGTWEPTHRVVVLLVLSFLAWLVAVFLTFRWLLGSIGL